MENLSQNLNHQISRFVAANQHVLEVPREGNPNAASNSPFGASANENQDFVIDMNPMSDNNHRSFPPTLPFSAHDIPVGLRSHLLRDENQNTEQNEGENPNPQGANPIPRVNLRQMLSNSVPFVLLILIRFLADHVLGAMVFLGLAGVFFYSNVFLKRIIHESSMRDAQIHKLLLSYFWCVIFLTANIACVYYVFREQELWKALIFQVPSSWQSDIFHFVWVVVVTDFMLKYICIIVKAFVSMVPMKTKHRGNYYMLIEHLVQMYRIVMPVVPWIHFMSDGMSWVFSAIILSLFFLMKGFQVVSKAVEVKNAFLALSIQKSFGVTPSSSDLKDRGESCPICHDDYQDPVMLPCKHIFCEDCVSLWFDREKNCPMCRAQVHSENFMYKDGSTATHIQWY